MKTLAEVFLEALTKPKVRLKSDGSVARITLDPDTVQKNRETVRNRGDLKVGDHIRFPYNHDRVHVITSIKKLPETDDLGNTHEIEAHGAGNIFKSSTPKYGYSSKRAVGQHYVAPKISTKPKKLKMGKHPVHGWVSNPRRDVYGDPGRHNPYGVKPKNG